MAGDRLGQNAFAMSEHEHMLHEIAAAWPQLSARNIIGLRGRSDLIARVSAVCGIADDTAQYQVDNLLRGRPI